jgi:hypothetical protein
VGDAVSSGLVTERVAVAIAPDWAGVGDAVAVASEYPGFGIAPLVRSVELSQYPEASKARTTAINRTNFFIISLFPFLFVYPQT